jgi:hypothetical protein
MPATNAAMKPEPSSAIASPQASAAPATGDDLPPRGRDQVPPARVGHDRSDQQPGDNAAEHAVCEAVSATWTSLSYYEFLVT